jgi:hypothetical protein
MMRFSPSPLLLVLLAAPFAAPLTAQGAEQDLRLALKKGASVWLVQETRSEQAIDMGGQAMETGNSTTYTMHLTVKEIDDKGLFVVEAKIARVAGSLAMGMMGDVEFDSIDQKADAPADDAGDDMGGMGMPDFDAIGRAMTSLAGHTFVGKVNAHGKVESLDGIDKALEAARKKAGRMGAQMLGGQLNDKAMERLVEGAFGTLPEKPIAVGGSWENSDTGKSKGLNVNHKLKLTLTKLDAESFEVTAAGTIEKPANTDAPAAGADEGEESAMAREMLAKMKIENGKLAGTSKVSRQDGFLLESTSTMTMDMVMPSPMGSGDMTITQKTTTTTRRTTEEAAMKKAGAAPAKEPAKDAPKDAGK